MASSRLRFAITMLLSLFSPAAEANRFADNPEFVIDRKSEAWTAPIGELESISAEVTARGTETRAGTGFLVSPCYVLTAHHVVYGDDLTPKPGVDYRMKFRAGKGVTTTFAGVTTATPVTSGFRDETFRNDWALLRLNVCIGKRPEFGWLETNSPSLHKAIKDGAKTGGRAMAMGYEGDRERGTLTGGIGKVIGIDPRNGHLEFTGSFVPGASGGPVMIDRDGVLTAVALNSAEEGDVHGATYASYKYWSNSIQSVYEIVNRPNIKPILESDKALSGIENPNLIRLQIKNIPQFASRPRLLQMSKER